ncbi:hypothetical protein KTI78_14730 [Acinetobacter sp. WU_MDCI_Abxe161]|uniref:hypothetical protein n=1 Tax=Acinetobacter sp. WU_MDCI_Abxe161 TaxID=2850074 RepID=UPI0021CD423B|nr:hypothetical protein [Acinetobacter sp. WU_MDCI_Abxe161]MCU4504413.1 hypothetical protein [Acinetobacter sp. WU_MDCI_Abxe161]
MKKIVVKRIDVKRFRLLVSHSRQPNLPFICEELDWLADDNEIVLGCLVQDKTDLDFGGVILGRDEEGRYRCFDLIANIETKEEALSWICNTIKWHVGQNQEVFPQGDGGKKIDLFSPVLTIDKQHPYFTKLSNEESFTPAKTVINILMGHFMDIDGNFVEQFQSTGFDARLWELYLDTYLHEENLFLNRDYHAPDFLVEKYGYKVAIEAVIVGRKQDNQPSLLKTLPKVLSPSLISEKCKNEMPIKFGSPLFSKLQKKYWEKEHVKGNPLVFAIADFHDDQSMQWSSNALMQYLYGYSVETRFENGQFIHSAVKIEKHQLGNKVIPSGFFSQPDTEHVSAVLFSASGTISKFNRIGKQAGFGSKDIIMFRFGTCHNHEEDATTPSLFRYQVTTESNETWAEGLSMFHNPNAKYPVPRELFPSIAHHYISDDRMYSFIPDFHPYSSMTMNFRTKRKKS